MGAASGSKACTETPADTSASINGIEGASRMSSVRGLNANPHTPIVLPFRLPKCLRPVNRYPFSTRSASVVATSPLTLVTIFNREIWRLEREAPELAAVLRDAIAARVGDN